MCIFVKKIEMGDIKQSFTSESLERFKKYRREGFTKNDMYKLFSKDALLELLYSYVEEEENTKHELNQTFISNIEKAEIINK